MRPIVKLLEEKDVLQILFNAETENVYRNMNFVMQLLVVVMVATNHLIFAKAEREGEEQNTVH